MKKTKKRVISCVMTAAAELLHRIQKHPHRIICEEFMDEK